MPTPLEIVITTKYSGAGAKAAVTDIKNVGEAAQSAGTKVTALGERIDRAGTRARIGLQSIAQLGNVAGVSIGGIVGPAASAADAVGDLASSLQGLKRADLLVGGITTGGIAALALFAQETIRLHDAQTQAIASNNEYYQSLLTLSNGAADVAAKIKVMAEAQNSIASMGSWNKIEAAYSGFQLAKIWVDDFIRGVQEGHPALRSLKQILEEINKELRNTVTAGGDAGAALKKLTGDADGAIGKGRSGADTDRSPLVKQFKGIASAASQASAAASQFRSMVESALTPTAADPNMGDAWDEARKRFEAFASGTDTGAYGEKFKQMFESLGMSAADAAAKFKDFSLFADPANLQLIDWGPVVANVEQQLLALAGKANVVAEAMKQVWANLSPQAKSALAAQGIDNSAEAIQALVDPAGAATEKVNTLSGAIKDVPTARTTTFTIEKGNSKDGTSFDDMLQKIKDAVNSIPTNIEVAVHLANGIPTADGTPTPPTTTPGGVKGFAHGGFIKREGLAYLHAGERVLNEQETEQFGQLPDNWRMLAGGWRGSRRGLYRKWLQSVQPPAEELAASGSVGGGGSAAGVGRIEDLLESIDRTLRYIAARGGMPSAGAAQPDMDALYNAMVRRLGRAAALRGL